MKFDFPERQSNLRMARFVHHRHGKLYVYNALRGDQMQLYRGNLLTRDTGQCDEDGDVLSDTDSYWDHESMYDGMQDDWPGLRGQPSPFSPY